MLPQFRKWQIALGHAGLEMGTAMEKQHHESHESGEQSDPKQRFGNETGNPG